MMIGEAESPHNVTFSAYATEKGPQRPRNADATAEHRHHDRFAVAIVDGTGSTEEVVEFAKHAAYHGVRVAARRSPMLGVLAVAEANADPLEEITSPDGAIIIAVAEKDELWRIAWVGDCVAFAWDGQKIRRITTPHTVGQYMRDSGKKDEIARKHDNKLFHSIGRSTISSVATTSTANSTIVLASDGMKLNNEQIELIFAENPTNMQSLAEELVRTSRSNGSRDDITVAVVRNPFKTDNSFPQDNPNIRLGKSVST